VARLQWFIGREGIGTFFAAAWKTCGGLRLVPTSANDQPDFAIYEFSVADKRWNAHSIHVLTLENNAISAMTLFLDPRLFHNVGLPQFLPDDAYSGLRNLSHNSQANALLRNAHAGSIRPRFCRQNFVPILHWCSQANALIEPGCRRLVVSCRRQ
jgi:hypothetical protein